VVRSARVIGTRWLGLKAQFPAYDPGVLLVGLTGGIGSGKSTVAGLLRGRGAVVIDADAIAREVVEPGSPTLARLVERFGEGILAEDGSLDRPALARVAFATEADRKDLDAITHPAIGERFLERIAAAPEGAIVVHDVPLLAESAAAASRGYAAIIVVEAPRDVRLARLEGRGLERADAEARMAQQATDEARRALASHLVDNAGAPEALEAQVDRIWADLERLRDEADASPPGS
jgi:dephospho-CoA kinase